MKIFYGRHARWWRWGGGVAGAGLLLAALWWGALTAFHAKFHQFPKTVELPKPANAAEGMRQDLQVLGQLLELDRSFSPAAVAQFQGERDALAARADRLSPEEFEMHVSRLVAISGNGHTTVVRRSQRLNLVPLRFAWFAEGLFVTRARAPYAHLLGSEVVAVNGRAPQEMLQGMRSFVSGTVDRILAVSPLLLQSPAALKGIGLGTSAQSASYEFRLPSGERVAVDVAGDAPQKKAAYTDPERAYSPLPIEKAPEGWQAFAPAGGALAAVQRDPDASLHVERMEGGKALYVHINMVMGDSRGDLESQLSKVLEDTAQRSLRYAVVDLRNNGGGNYMEATTFAKELPKRVAPDGKVFILTNAHTFSAAIVTAARLRYFAGERSVMLGEHVGDAEQFWAESAARIVLPNSKIAVNYATGYHDWANGCGWKDWDRCFWFNFAYDVPAKTLAPDVVVPWKWADYARGVDSVMEEVGRRVKAQAAP
jgi:hypothetical protein